MYRAAMTLRWDKEAPIYTEVRRVFGENLFDLPGDEWLPRKRLLQPVFTQHRVAGFTGQVAQAAEPTVGQWRAEADIDLATQADTRRDSAPLTPSGGIAPRVDGRACQECGPARPKLARVNRGGPSTCRQCLLLDGGDGSRPLHRACRGAHRRPAVGLDVVPGFPRSMACVPSQSPWFWSTTVESQASQADSSVSISSSCSAVS
jgi:hypothetical protein